MDVSIPDMKRMFDTDFWGVVYGSRAAANHYQQRGSAGALINVGSFLGDRAVAVQSTYSAAKHAVHGWTDALRMELEADKAPVSVTLIHPGRIDTPYNEHARSYMPNQPAHRGMIYPPEAVAEAILYAAEHPKRDMFVGLQAKLLAILGGDVSSANRQVDGGLGVSFSAIRSPFARSRGQCSLSGWLWNARARNPSGLDSFG